MLATRNLEIFSRKASLSSGHFRLCLFSSVGANGFSTFLSLSEFICHTRTFNLHVIDLSAPSLDASLFSTAYFAFSDQVCMSVNEQICLAPTNIRPLRTLRCTMKLVLSERAQALLSVLQWAVRVVLRQTFNHSTRIAFWTSSGTMLMNPTVFFLLCVWKAWPHKWPNPCFVSGWPHNCVLASREIKVAKQFQSFDPFPDSGVWKKRFGVGITKNMTSMMVTRSTRILQKVNGWTRKKKSFSNRLQQHEVICKVAKNAETEIV